MKQTTVLTGRSQFPAQLWILFGGTLLSMTAQSLVWPFLTIHIANQLAVPLTQITLLFTVQTLASLGATTILGPAMDRFGRKWAMVLGPLLSAVVQVLMINAASMPAWAVLLSGHALGGVMFRIGSNAMIADLVPPEQRAGAYALLRMAFNIGIAVGPVFGGLLIDVSYALSFSIAAAAQVLMALFVLVIIRESLTPQAEETATVSEPDQRRAGYGPLLRDRPFMTMWGVYLLIEIGASTVFTLLAVYIKNNFGIPEREFGLILGTNAAMVVFFQYLVTRFTQRRAPLLMMAAGAALYALGFFGFAVGWNFFTFWLGMVVMTLGELILVPTATAMAANLAPPDMRARYMGVFGLSYRVGSGVGPVMGGFLSDTIAPAATWYGALVCAATATGGFLLMARQEQFAAKRQTTETRSVAEGPAK